MNKPDPESKIGSMFILDEKRNQGKGSLKGAIDELAASDDDGLKNFVREMSELYHHNVEVIAIDNTAGIRSADLKIDGTIMELKTIKTAEFTDTEQVSGKISHRILAGRSQSGSIVIDARAQKGMNKEIADKAFVRAIGMDKEKRKIIEVVIVTDKGAFGYTVKRGIK